MIVFLWVILYGLIYTAGSTAGLFWSLPLGMTVYTAAFLIWICRSGYAGRIALSKRPALSRALLPLLALPISNLLLGGFRFPGWGVGILLVCTSVTEELFFRGFLLHRLLGKGTENAVLGTSILFGLLHFANLPAGADWRYTLIQVLCAFCVSICYCRVTLLWDSLLPCMAAHILTNLTACGNPSDGHWLPCMAAVILSYIGYSLWLKNPKKEINP